MVEGLEQVVNDKQGRQYQLRLIYDDGELLVAKLLHQGNGNLAN
jgi:hypothetical protein